MRRVSTNWLKPKSSKKTAAKKHGRTDNAVKNRAPIDGQAALDNSVQIKPTSHRRVGIDNVNGEIVVLDRTREISDGVEEFHGHVREWDDLHPDQQKALKNAKKINKRGKIIDQEGKNGSCWKQQMK